MKFENIYRETEENLRLALLSLWAPGSHPMRPAIEELFDREPLLAEPVFQSTFGWESVQDETWKDYLHKDIIEQLQIGVKHTPYKHQAESWKALKEGKSIVVTSGTGSGKTECFMYPVLDDLSAQGKQRAIEAIFLYPLNALMDDQKKRLNDYCEATGLRFAVYNGDTPEYENIPNDAQLVEIPSRQAIRNAGTRPEILLTNPSMLEYILVRQEDQQMLQESAGKLRWIVIDEAHTYSGSAAVELAYQIKRILEAFGTTPDQVRFACTSATIGGEEGTQSLIEFISTITGQSAEKIQVIGGNRLVPPLDTEQLSTELLRNGLPSVDRVLSLRNRINEVAGMTIQQIWEWLYPEKAYNKDSILPALQLLDKLCEIKQDNNPVLSLRAHYFMRAINGLYACANSSCEEANTAKPIYGHLTTYKSSTCECGVPLLELVQCKRCGGFVLMGCSDSNNNKISPCEEDVKNDDYFSIDLSPDEDEEEQEFNESTDTFFLMPYEGESFFNPVSSANVSTINIDHSQGGSLLRTQIDNVGQWVEVRREGNRSYCPNCGQLAQGKRLYFKHFRIPISFINQAISPVLLHECAPEGHTWGKYIAFTDSRQGTAISAKTFNIDVERTMSRQKILQKLAKSNIPACIQSLPEEMREIALANYDRSFSLQDVSNCIFDESIFNHITNNRGDKDAYKAALLRQIIGRKSLFENSIENMGLISLVYPGLNNINTPNAVKDYTEGYGVDINDSEWRDFLKISLDYFFRVGNHIQPQITGERDFLRDGSFGVPVAAPDNNKEGVPHWPTIKVDGNDVVSAKQHRLILLLCAGLEITSPEALYERRYFVDSIMQAAWKDLVDKKLIKEVSADDTEGYNRSRDNKYVSCYYLDLSAGSDVCCIKSAKKVQVCPVTGNIIDTTFRGYSPYITGEVDARLFERYKCSEELIDMPIRPENDEDVDNWVINNENVRKLKEKGLWSDRHKYSYKKLPTYLAAEHSAQQSKERLREYTKAFSQPVPSINVLHCSTTMEMGVDIGDIEVVLMDTVPPTAANYLQRVGRAGRKGQSKAIAFSLCNNTAVGQNAFDNPMWALQTTNHMIKVRPSQIIIQRHINSFFFRQFICGIEQGIKVKTTVSEFMETSYKDFVKYLNNMSTNDELKAKFHSVFGNDTSYDTINITIAKITNVRAEYRSVIDQLRAAYDQYPKNERRRIAICNQIRKCEDESLLHYLSGHQFIPNANMPTGVVTFDFMSEYDTKILNRLYNELAELIREHEIATDAIQIESLKACIREKRKEINGIKKSATASRDIRTALNEYAPGQTVVVNEKNYVSAGVSLIGEYNDETQTRYIYRCRQCGRTEYSANLDENKLCPDCGEPYRGIFGNNTRYTVAYEPVGFRTDQTNGTREEKTTKRYYDIRPVLLETNWTTHNDVNLCEVTSSGENGVILCYNLGIGHGFAFCKRCGRAVIETESGTDNIPEALRPLHNSLYGGVCEAKTEKTENIARHIVFTGKHPTCYTALRFKNEIGATDYVNDKQLVYSIGVVMKRALAKSEGIDEGEIDFGIKQERDAMVLFIYDTAKGGCGYSLKPMTPALCQDIFDIARKDLEETTCNCHIVGGACPRCLVDRNNERNAHLLSKKLVLDWLNKQKNNALEIPNDVIETSPNAKVVYQSFKDVVEQAIKDPEVRRITLCVSDETDDYAVSDWTSVRSRMGKYINQAISNGKKVSLAVEYHPELHTSLYGKSPFLNLKGKFSDCEVQFIEDMGRLKTAVIVETGNTKKRYFTNKEGMLSFSNNWGADSYYAYVDDLDVEFGQQEEPTYTITPNPIMRDGIIDVKSFEIKDYFKVIANALEPQDLDMLANVLRGKQVDISFSDMYVNSALASLMLVYLIKGMKDLFGFTIKNVMLQLDSRKRKCDNERFNEYTTINLNFPSKEEADNYTDKLFNDLFGVDAEHSFKDADHHRWLRIETEDGAYVEIRPDHGISGGYRTSSTYLNIDSLGGSVVVTRNDEKVLYYVIIDNGQNAE